MLFRSPPPYPAPPEFPAPPLVQLPTSAPARAASPGAKEYLKAEYSSISDEELEKLGAGALYRAAVEGDEKTGDFLAGQVAGMVTKEQPAAEMIREMFAEAEEVLKGAGKWLC